MKLKKIKMKKKTLNIIAVTAIVGALAAGGTMAYLTDHAETTNEFTVGKVDIDLTEPNWKPEENKKIEPSQVITKDPQITNNGVNDAFVYLEVSIPVENVTTANADGTRIEAKETELFSFAAKNDWTRIDKRKAGKSQVYTYSYNKILKKGETTTPLFDTVTFANVIEGQLDTQTLQIPVRAYAIQTVNTGNNGGSVIEQAKNAYKKYVNQNINQPGAATGQTTITSDPGNKEEPGAGDVLTDPGTEEEPGVGDELTVPGNKEESGAGDESQKQGK